MLLVRFFVIFITFLLVSCSSANSPLEAISPIQNTPPDCDTSTFNYNNQKGCDGRTYPDPSSSPYVIPFPPGTSFKTGLTNCSSSYHSAQYPDRYAFDFNVAEGTSFYAARAGVVVYIKEDQPSGGGGGGNWVVVKHQDNTFGIYLHSPKNGISVNLGDTVEKGDLLGITGRSGLAGYPHLHFIVVQNDYRWPYDAIPITFKNISPADVIVKSYTNYKACNY